MNKSTGLLEIHLAVFLFGVPALFGKFLSLSPFMIVLGRVVFASLTLLTILKMRKQPLALTSKSDYLYLALLGVVLAAHWVTFFHAIQISTVAIGLLAFSTYPIIISFLEPYLLGETIRLTDVVLAVLASIGVGLVIPNLEIRSSLTQGILWGLVSAILFAILTVFNRQYVKKYSSLVITLYEDVVVAGVLLPFLFILRPTVQVRDILLLALLGTVFTALSHALFVKGMRQVKARQAGTIANLAPVYGILLAVAILGETLTLKIAIGGLLVLTAAFLSTIESKRQSSLPSYLVKRSDT